MHMILYNFPVIFASVSEIIRYLYAERNLTLSHLVKRSVAHFKHIQNKSYSDASQCARLCETSLEALLRIDLRRISAGYYFLFFN